MVVNFGDRLVHGHSILRQVNLALTWLDGQEDCVTGPEERGLFLLKGDIAGGPKASPFGVVIGLVVSCPGLGLVFLV